MTINYDIIAIIATAAAAIWAVAVTVIIAQHSARHRSRSACIDMMVSIMADQVKLQGDNAEDIITLEHNYESLEAVMPRLGICSICGKTDFIDNMAKITGKRLNSIGVVPLKGDLEYLPGELVILHADCAGIRKCDSAIGWEKIPLQKGSK